MYVFFCTYIQDKSVTMLSVCAQKYIQIQTCKVPDDLRHSAGRCPAAGSCRLLGCDAGGLLAPTTPSSALYGPPSGCRLLPVAGVRRGGLAGSDYNIFCTLLAAVRQLAPAGCRAAALWGFLLRRHHVLSSASSCPAISFGWLLEGAPPTALYAPPPALKSDHTLPYVHNPSHGPNTYTCRPLWIIHPQPGRAALILSAAIDYTPPPPPPRG